MARALPLNLYRLVPMAGGEDFDEFCELVLNRDSGEPDQYDATVDLGYEAKLFVRSSSARRPNWGPFLEQGFGEIDALAESSSHGALLVIRTNHAPPNDFAFTFGQGRHLLRPGSYEQNYGLRVLLNLLSAPVEQPELEDDNSRGGAVRSVEAKTLSNNILHTHRQTDRRATFETFGVDPDSDLIRAITGHPDEIELWGGRVTGGHSLRLNQKVQITGLAELGDRVEQMARRDYYKQNYAWIDNVRAVVDPTVKDALTAHIIDLLNAGNAEALSLAPPAVISWDQPVGFAFSNAPEAEFDDVDLEKYLATDPLPISLDSLKDHRLVLTDGEGDPVDQWSVFRSLAGEIHLDNRVYVLHDGVFYEIQPSYLAGLDAYLDQRLSESGVALPVWVGFSEEKVYNKHAVDTSGGELLLLDRKNIKISTQTSAIEFCDLLSKENQLVHVKPYSGSATLSHLFAQGFVSADLFLMSREFRVKALEKVQEQEVQQNHQPGTFASFGVDAITPSDYEIVFAIIGEWNGAPLHAVLPFFSKVNIRRTGENLRRMGYRVTYKLVERQ